MQIVEGLVSRPVEACWRAFTNVAKLSAWVPGLRDARVIDTRPDGLASEVMFEFVTGSIYSLVYRYDLAERTITWEPREGEQGGVRGEVSFDDVDRGTKVTYAIEQVRGRRAVERAIDDPHQLVAAFTRWMDDGNDDVD
ncbi:MAG: hypothetical protein NT062_38615 [Proteobacteria bacterium]|nr:hypothetical protein [Pseudomonadota bacterium]